MANENRSRIGIGEFTHNALALSDDEFEKAMRLDNHDKDINDIEINVLTKETIEAYERA